jgi:hypothetical protein
LILIDAAFILFREWLYSGKDDRIDPIIRKRLEITVQEKKMAANIKNGKEMILSPFGESGMGQQVPSPEDASRGFEQYSQIFGKYISAKDEKHFSTEEKGKRDRAKRANRIYKQVCEETGLKACFFSNFGEWSEYIDGRMSDDEFQSHAVSLARQMAAAEN